MTALRIEDLSIAFGGLVAVDRVSVDIASGERRVFLGPNGAGKTTLFNLIGGQLRPTHGRILLFGDEVTGLSAHQRAQAGISRTFQITNLFPYLTLADNVLLAVQASMRERYVIHRSHRSFDKITSRVEAIIEEWGFGDERANTVRNLSYGQQRKLEIAMALAHQPRVLLLDEPTAGLSSEETESFIALINGLDRAVTILIIEHDMDVAFRVGERFTILDQGRILVEGAADEVRGDERVLSIYFGSLEDEA